LKAAYPIHPELFERLYNDWSTQAEFQRTRGVLRLMAAVIHSLWENGDRNPLIMPANIPLEQPQVQYHLTRYLADNWEPIIKTDIDGANSLPIRIDSEVTNLGKYAACRRIARAVYLGSAPLAKAANPGLDERRIKLGCVMPGEQVSVFTDGLRRLATTATYLYQDETRYWYSTQPTVTKLAEERAEQLKQKPVEVRMEIEQRVRENLRARGDFNRIHAFPVSSADVPDDPEARLVVLSTNQAYDKNGDNLAMAAARAILENRGSTPRLFRNMLIFLAPDKKRVEDIEEGARIYLAWKSILADVDKEQLDLTHAQIRQAKTQRDNADVTVQVRIPETFTWLLVPKQNTPQVPIEWVAEILVANKAERLKKKNKEIENLAELVSKRVRNDSSLIMNLSPTTLRLEMDSIPLWRDNNGNHVSIRQLIEDFGRYHFLSRLSSPQVLKDAIQKGLLMPTWEQETFAYAEDYDESKDRYIGLRAATMVGMTDEAQGLLVHPEVARRQFDAEKPPEPKPINGDGDGYGYRAVGDVALPTPPSPPLPPPPKKARRFYGSVILDTLRAGKAASEITDEVIVHLSGLEDAKVKVTLEIEADIPAGVPADVVRTVQENSRSLNFIQATFELE
jgi:hypothetical protein